MTTIQVGYTPKMLDGLFAVVQHAAKDGVTTVIETVKVSGGRFVATNRFTVGEYRHAAGEAGDGSAEGEHVLIPRQAAEWLVKQTPKVLGLQVSDCPDYRVEFTAEAVTVVHAESGDVRAVTRFQPVSGNYPPVERLFPSDDKPLTPHGGENPAVPLTPALVELFVKGAKRLDKHTNMTFTLQGTENPNKPGPILVEVGERFRGLLQPNLLVRR